MAIVNCQRSESNLKPLLFVHFLSTPFAFKDTAVFGCLLSQNEYAAIQKRAKRDEFLIHSADVMRSRSSRRRPTESRPYECHVFTEPGLKETIICPWRMGNLLCTGTRSLRLAINNNPATAQLPQNSSAMSSLVCVSKRGRKNGNSFWPSEGPPEPHISEGKSLSAFSKAPNVCETGSHTVLGLIGT
jgi:hypothetical protein